MRWAAETAAIFLIAAAGAAVCAATRIIDFYSGCHRSTED